NRPFDYSLVGVVPSGAAADPFVDVPVVTTVSTPTVSYSTIPAGRMSGGEYQYKLVISKKETSGTEHYSYLTPFEPIMAQVLADNANVKLQKLPTWMPDGFQLVVYRTPENDDTDFKQVGTVGLGVGSLLDDKADGERTDALPQYVLQSLPGLTPA